MAYQGGIYTQPIIGDTSKIAQFYLDGVMNINKIRLQVQEDRTKELGKLAEAAAKIETTGYEDMDNMFSMGAIQLRNAAYDAHNANRRGDITRAEATQLINSYISDASRLGNISTKAKKQNEDIKKGVLDNKIHQYSDIVNSRPWFKDQNLQETYYTLANGEKVQRKESWTPEIINGRLQSVRRYNYVDQKGELVNAIQVSSMSELYNPNPKLLDPFDMSEYVTDFVKTIGDRVAPEYNFSQMLGSTRMFTAIRDAGELPALRDTIENELQSMFGNDDNVIRVLSSQYGAMAPGDLGWKGYKTQEQLKNLYGKATYRAEDGQTLLSKPRYYDENGDDLKATIKDGMIIDPTVFELDEYGNEIITEQHRELAKAVTRDRILQGLDVDYHEFWEKGGGAGTGQQDITVSQLTTLVGGDGNRVSYNENSLLNDLLLQEEVKKEITGTSRQFENYKQTNMAGAVIPLGDSQVKTYFLGKRAGLVTNSVSFAVNQGTTNRGEISKQKQILKDIKVNTAGDRQFKEVTGMFMLNQGLITDANGKLTESPEYLVLRGISDYTMAKTALAGLGPSAESLAAQSTRTLDAPDFLVVTDEILPQIYENFYEYNIGGFRNFVSTITQDKATKNADRMNHFKQYLQAKSNAN